MASATIFGIALLVAATLVLVTGPLFTNSTAGFKAYLWPQHDKQTYRQKNIKYLRRLVMIWAILGVGFIIVGLITGP